MSGYNFLVDGDCNLLANKHNKYKQKHITYLDLSGDLYWYLITEAHELAETRNHNILTTTTLIHVQQSYDR